MEKLRRTFAIDVAYTHFPLHPDTPEAGQTLEELFAGRDFDIAATQAHLARLMADEGLPYGVRTMTYDSRLAQELGKWAETQPDGDGIHVAIFQAYFVDDVNLAKIDNLVAVAERAGLPGAAAREALEERHFRSAVDADWQRSSALGVSGVPTFVIGKRGIVGAQPYEQLEGFVVSSGAVRRRSELPGEEEH